MKKRLARVALPKADPKVRAEIEKQIEAQADLFIPAEFGLLLQYNLTNPVDLVMALRGVKEKEAIQFLERNKDLNKKYGAKPPEAPNLTSVFGEKPEGGEE